MAQRVHCLDTATLQQYKDELPTASSHPDLHRHSRPLWEWRSYNQQQIWQPSSKQTFRTTRENYAWADRQHRLQYSCARYLLHRPVSVAFSSEIYMRFMDSTGSSNIMPAGPNAASSASCRARDANFANKKETACAIISGRSEGGDASWL